jgi:predicted nucleic acid-binding protein
MPLLVDTGVLYALADRSDAWHLRARHYIESIRDTLLAPVTILPEVAYLLHTRIGPRAERAFVRALADGELAVENLSRRDWLRSEELMGDYDEIGLVDATVVAIAERLKLTTIATTDRRHFAMVQPAHVQRFSLVP